MLTRLRLENFKSWKDTGEITFKPITGFFGPNSSGKSSLFQAFLLMKQTAYAPDRGIMFNFGDETTLVDLGDFESVIHKHDTKQPLKFSLGWNATGEIEMPRRYAGGTVAEGDKIGFEAEIREESIGSGKSLLLEEMSYRLTDDRRFGMTRIPSLMGYDYELFARRSNSNFSDPIHLWEPEHERHPLKFYAFPSWAEESPKDRDFLLDLQYELESFLEALYYLGPSRVFPTRIYARSGAQPIDTGQIGESVVDALLSSREQEERIRVEERQQELTLEEYVAEWLKRLKLVHDFRVEALAEGRRLFEVKVRKSPSSTEVLLADVGFGVSQILPVLVLCFYVPQESTAILEQPDIHLHPSAQASLADVFIDAWKKRDTQILFESHSEHLLRRLQRRIAEGELQEDDVGLFFCSTDDSGGSRLSQLEVDRFGNIANWPNDFFGDQFGEIAAMSEAALKKQGDSE